MFSKLEKLLKKYRKLEETIDFLDFEVNVADRNDDAHKLNCAKKKLNDLRQKIYGEMRHHLN
jgi:hypothetical protein